MDKQVNKSRVFSLCLLTAAWLMPCAIVCGQSFEIRLYEQVRLGVGSVSLGDIAEVSSPEASDKERLENIYVDKLSDQMRTFEVGYDQIARLLAGSGIAPGAVDLFGASCCRVSLMRGQESAPGQPEYASPEISLDRAQANGATPSQQSVLTVEQELKRRIALAVGVDPEELFVQWQRGTEEILQSPYESVRFEIQPRSHLSLGQVRFELDEREDQSKKDISASDSSGGSGRTVRITGLVELQCSAVYARRSIQAGQSVGYEDVEAGSCRIRDLSERPVGDIEAIVGQEAARRIVKGDVICPDKMLRKLILVNRRDPVRVLCRKGSIQITCEGMALENGSLGDSISVSSGSRDRNVVRARVVGVGEVVLGQEEPMESSSYMDSPEKQDISEALTERSS